MPSLRSIRRRFAVATSLLASALAVVLTTSVADRDGDGALTVNDVHTALDWDGNGVAGDLDGDGTISNFEAAATVTVAAIAVRRLSKSLSELSSRWSDDAGDELDEPADKSMSLSFHRFSSLFAPSPRNASRRQLPPRLSSWTPLNAGDDGRYEYTWAAADVCQLTIDVRMAHHVEVSLDGGLKASLTSERALDGSTEALTITRQKKQEDAEVVLRSTASDPNHFSGSPTAARALIDEVARRVGVHSEALITSVEVLAADVTVNREPAAEQRYQERDVLLLSLCHALSSLANLEDGCEWAHPISASPRRARLST